ncbi:WG repeat-containing protein [Paenibacillus sp. GSMTC-2017]|uniref:WG repeat-containing protein n=1 Tax=Paenibacillus sp. GSMTC-2017 TaxID=2794350 RepID=UPI0018D655A1|nr:WG repeat-containing protein [Paenibacillus sp. GSMTC-2017]MBH5320339.1 WG repeat-containing protein [Paenibacillus sp. GSMTC-2017]
MKVKVNIFISMLLFFSLASVASAAPSSKFAIEAEYDYAGPFQDGVAIVSVDGMFGLINKSGEQIVEPIYTEMGDFVEGFSTVINDEGLSGIIDTTGKEVLPLKYDFVDIFKEDLAAVLTGDKWGFVDKKGKLVIPATFQDASRFYNGYAVIVNEEGHVGFINKTGKVIKQTKLYLQTEIAYEEFAFEEGFVWLRDDKDRLGFYSLSGKEILKPTYDSAVTEFYADPESDVSTYYFEEGLTVVSKDLKRVIVDTKGKVVAKLPQYDGLQGFIPYNVSEGTINVGYGEEEPTDFGVINKNGKQISFGKYNTYGGIKEGLVIVENNDKFGFADKNGKIVIKAQYDDVWTFKNGLAWVQKGKKWAIIDKKGKIVIDFKYESPGEYNYFDKDIFINGLAFVGNNDGYGLIDRNGKEVLALEYMIVGAPSEGLVPVSLDGEKFGYVAVPTTN